MPVWKKEDDKTNILVTCQCGNTMHQLNIFYDDGTFYVEPSLNVYLGFFRRVKSAIRYVFGGKHNGFADMVLYRDDVEKLIEHLKGFVECQ